MSRSLWSRVLAPALAVLAVLALAAGCSVSYPATPLPVPSPSASTSSAGGTADSGPAPSCGNPLASYAPTKNGLAMPSGSTMDTIRKRGRLIAGVSADSYLLGARNPVTNQIEGFDIDMVNAVAAAIFGTARGHVELRVITAADRLTVLQKNQVDIVVRAMTINCDRWSHIAFSTEYYAAGQKLMVSKESKISSVNDLSGKRVCAPTGTSTISQIRKLAPKAVIVPQATHTGCLVQFQQGKVDVITGDDTVLAGLAAQDPYAKVVAGKAFTAEPYGIGVNADNVDLVRFINAVLQQMRTDGRWTASYDKWLAPSLGKAPNPPAAVYGR